MNRSFFKELKKEKKDSILHEGGASNSSFSFSNTIQDNRLPNYHHDMLPTKSNDSMQYIIRHLLRLSARNEILKNILPKIFLIDHRKSDVRKICDRQGERERLTTPTLTLSGLGSARKASVTPRIGSLGAGSTFFHHDDILLEPKIGRLIIVRREAELRIVIAIIAITLFFPP